MAFKNIGGRGRPVWLPPDPGSGPAGPALADATLVPPEPPPGDSHIVAHLEASTAEGGAPLRVRFDASASKAATGAPLAFAWDFGDGTAGGGSQPGSASDVLRAAGRAYATAKRSRDAGRYEDAVAQYLAVASTRLPLTSDTDAGSVTKRGTNQVNRVARWYLPALNGATGNMSRATSKLARAGCVVPEPTPMFPNAAADVAPAGAVVEHVYTRRGTFTARVTASDGTQHADASLTITVDGDGLPDAPGEPSDNDADRLDVIVNLRAQSAGTEMTGVVRTRAGCLPRDRVDQGFIERTDGWDVGESEPFRLGPGA